MIEARHARVPLIVLTADRPPELREVGAGQTIDQLKLYGDAVKWFFEVGVDTTPRLRAALDPHAGLPRVLDRRARPTGPVHLNFPLREPLVLDRPLALPDDDTGRGGDRPYVTSTRAVERGPAGRTPPVRAHRHRGRRGARRDRRARIGRLRGAGGDPAARRSAVGARRGPAAIAHYDLLLRDPEFADAHRPEFVIRVGDLPTSKPLRAWLARARRGPDRH